MSNVFIDCDQTVFDMLPDWLRLYNNDYNDNLQVRDITSYELVEFVKPECGKQIYDYLYSPDLFTDVPLMPDAMTAIVGMAMRGHHISFFTSIPGECYVARVLDIERNFGEYFKYDVYLISDKIRPHLPADIFIDDCPAHLIKYKCMTSATVICFARPYNRNIPRSHYDFIGVWPSIDRYLGGPTP